MESTSNGSLSVVRKAPYSQRGDGLVPSSTRISAEERAALERLARESGKSVSWVVREAIQQRLDRESLEEVRAAA